MAKNDGRVDLLETSIQNFSCKNGRGIVETVDGEFLADWVFQSVLPPPGFEKAKVDISLLQHFVGWEIEAESEIFNPERAVFMDFDLPQKNGVTFMYVLPFSKKRALVEYTLFSRIY
jgi:lycopene beta-cyclase